MKVKYEDSRYKSHEQSYDEMIADLKKYADAGDYGCYITTLNDKALEEYNEKHPDTLIDGSFYFGDYENNLSEGIGQRKDIHIVPEIIYVSETGMERLTGTPVISAIGVNIKDRKQLKQIDSELQSINSTLTHSEWQFESALGKTEQFNQMTYAENLTGNGIALLLIVTGLINFVNVMLTGVVARKNEFAIMESIGTSKKQIQKILTLEGGIYALVTTALIMTFGNAFLLLVADAVPHIADYAEFEYPFTLVICLIFVIFIIYFY